MPLIRDPLNGAGLSEHWALARFRCHGECKPTMWVWGRAPSGGPWAEPPCGVRGQSPLNLNAFYILLVQRKPQICPITDKMNMAKTTVSHSGSEARGPAQAWALGKSPPHPCLGPALSFKVVWHTVPVGQRVMGNSAVTITTKICKIITNSLPRSIHEHKWVLNLLTWPHSALHCVQC